jgi:type I restriction enzyme S subunit
MTAPTVPLRRVARVVNGGTPKPEPDMWDGPVPWATPIDLARVDGGIVSETDRTLTREGLNQGSKHVPAQSVLLSTRAPIGYVARTAGMMAFNQGCKAVVPFADLDVRCLAYWLWASRDRLQALGSGSTFMELGNEPLLGFPVPLLPVEEQRRIADFLDDQVTRIDNIIAARQQQVESLLVEHIATIYEQMTGLPGDEPRSAAELSWVRSLPRSWSLRSVGSLFEVQLGKMLNEERARGPHLAPYLRNANVSWYRVDTEDLAEMSFEPGDTPRYQVQGGDLLVCEGGAGIAEAAVWPPGSPPMFFQKSLHRLRPRSEVPVEWVMYWLRLAKSTGIFAAEGQLTTIPHLPAESFRRYRIPVPPDVSARVGSLSLGLSTLNARSSWLDRSSGLLLELKRSLISAAVSGEFDVSTASGRGVPE